MNIVKGNFLSIGIKTLIKFYEPLKNLLYKWNTKNLQKFDKFTDCDYNNLCLYYYFFTMKRKKYKSSNYICIAVWLIFLLSWILIYPNIKLLVTGTKTVAVVNNVHRNSDTYSIKAQYDCWSKTWILWNSSMSSSSYNYNVWEKIEIYCDEWKPETFLPKEFSNYLLILFPLIWLFMLLFWIKKEVLRQELIKTGMKVEATIIGITPIWSKMDKQGWYTITAQYWEDTFTSKNAFDNTNKILKEWDKIDVYLDVGDHSKYWVDIDSAFEKIEDNSSILNQ